jgi:hypothetical protein
MSGAEPCTGSNSDGCSRDGLMLAEGAMPIVPVHGRAEVAQDVAEQVARDDGVEELRPLHEVRGQDVDVEAIGPDVGIACRHRVDALVPVRHRDRDAVRLGRRGEVLLRPRLRELEGELQDPVDADRDITVSWTTISRSVSGYIRPPMLEYSPSVFSRTIIMSMSPGSRPASGERTPGINRAGAG